MKQKTPDYVEAYLSHYGSIDQFLNYKTKKMKEKILKWLQWIIIAATAISEFLSKIVS